MKTRSMGIFAMVMVVGVLCVGVVALATDFVWDGDGIGTGGGTEAWTNATMWVVGSGFPDNGADNATLADPSTSPICDYSPGNNLTINNLVITGSSPTWMVLNVKGDALTVNDLDQNAYGELDIDENLTVDNETFMSGNVRVNVAANKTFDAGAMTIDRDTILNMTTAGTFKAHTVDIDADTPDAARTLKVAGSGATFDVLTKLTLKSDQASGTNRAKLWVLTGTVDVDDGAGGNGVLEIDGGNDLTRKAELDIDDILVAEETRFEPGYAAIDVASGKTAKGGDVIFKGSATSGEGVIVTKTGSGTFRSGPV